MIGAAAGGNRGFILAKVRIGVVGAGGISNTHLGILSKRPDEVELVGIADVRIEAAQAAAAKYGAASSTADYHDLLTPAVDAIVVCVPTFLHAEIAAAALRAGKHVFCEKPMARTLDQAVLMVDAARESGKALQCGFVRRFDDEWLAFRTAIRDAKIGRPVIWQNVSAGSGPSAAWFNVDEQGGGPFLDGCIHNIDFALYTFGPAEWAFAHLRTFGQGHTALDTGTASVRFTSGDELMLAWSWGLPSGVSGAGVFQFLGPEGVLSWPRDHEPGSDTRRFIVNRGDQKESVTYPASALNRGYERQMEEFIQVARGEKQPGAGPVEGMESLRLALAILESGRTQQVVRL